MILPRQITIKGGYVIIFAFCFIMVLLTLYRLGVKVGYQSELKKVQLSQQTR
jgi:hypothetical protein